MLRSLLVEVINTKIPSLLLKGKAYGISPTVTHVHIKKKSKAWQ